jgi:hypothetical protein
MVQALIQVTERYTDMASTKGIMFEYVNTPNNAFERMHNIAVVS